jgi:hypothetical protein
MAIITGPKLVKDLPEKDRVAIGITLPIQRGNGGFFAQSYQTSEQVKSNIKNLILKITLLYELENLQTLDLNQLRC